jgi:SNF2 family DNA or RNA helicase
MATIQIEFIGTKLKSIIANSDFHILIDVVKNCFGQYNANSKIWHINLNNYNLNILKPYMIQDHYNKLLEYLQDESLLKPELNFLLPFQREGVKQLLAGKILLADDVGLGKTLQLLAFAEQKNLAKVLVICPAPLKYQWQTEIKKFLAKPSVVLEGDKLARNKSFNDFFYESPILTPEDVQFGQKIQEPKNLLRYLIINYEQLLNNEFLATKKYDLVILDEVHRIKNNSSKTHTMAKKLLTNFKLGATATPFVNNPRELYNIVNFLKPKFFNYVEFLTRYCIQGTIYNHKLRREIQIVVSYKNLSELNTRLKTIMCRRHKSEVMPQLPERSYQKYEITLNPYQQEISDYFINLAKNSASDENILSCLTMSRLAANSLLQIKNSTSPLASNIRITSTENSKIKALLEILETINEKVIIFSQWQISAYEIAASLPKDSTIIITGQTSDKTTALDEFKINPAKKYLVATDCLNYGLNIPEAHIMVHFDSSYSPSVNEQREGRIDRLTQQNKMLIITLMAKKILEEIVKKSIRCLALQLMDRQRQSAHRT